MNSTINNSVANGWKGKKEAFNRLGFEAPGAVENIKMYDNYLFKMEEALKNNNWLVGNKFSIADVAMTPYVNRLAMMSMTDMWENGRLPRVAAWFGNIKSRPTFQSSLLNWVPEDLSNDLRKNGAMSWPEVAKILGIN